MGVDVNGPWNLLEKSQQVLFAQRLRLLVLRLFMWSTCVSNPRRLPSAHHPVTCTNGVSAAWLILFKQLDFRICAASGLSAAHPARWNGPLLTMLGPPEWRPYFQTEASH